MTGMMEMGAPIVQMGGVQPNCAASSTRNWRVHSLLEGGYAALHKLLGGTGVIRSTA